MGIFYQEKDRDLFDYQMEELHGEWFRGPLDLGPDSIAWLGAAQTFGRFVKEPFPRLVSSGLRLGSLNLGSGGKGPDYYLRHPELIEEINNCRAAVVQVMSAKASENSLYRSQFGGGKGRRVDTGKLTLSVMPVVRELLAQGKRREARKVVLESQRAYVDSMRKLLNALRPPTILLWFSVRRPAPSVLGVLWTVKNVSPQLINRRVLNQITPFADSSIAVVSRAGLPQDLRDETGNIVKRNAYYPSPEMHREVADRLMPVLSEIVR